MNTQAAKENNAAIPDNIPFIDLAAQQARIKSQIDKAIASVLAHGKYIMGPEVQALEEQLAAFTGVQHVISCSSGTDALALALMAKGVKAGDAVFVPSFTFAATAEVVAWLGSTAVFVDSEEDSFNICPVDLERAIDWAKAQGLNLTGVITVDLFGLPADYDVLEPLADAHDMWIMDDAAQGLGATYKNRKIGTIGEVTATSFFPAKPLGCYGDGGAIFTDNAELADTIKSLRVHGKGRDKYDNVRIGMNGRLDTMQAAVLLPKLEIFADELEKRQQAARYYNDGLQDVLKVPLIESHSTSAWAQYTVVLPEHVNRDQFAATLKTANIPTAVYYPKPLHQQTAYQSQGRSQETLPVCEKLSQSVISLPMHPYIERQTQDYIIETVKLALT